MESKVAKLGEACLAIATRAAVIYLRKENQEIDIIALEPALRQCCREASQDAIADAAEAAACGMTQVAALDFQASFVLAGIRAAKMSLVSIAS